MLKTLAFATVSCIVFNKLAYHLLLKAPSKLKTEILASGQYATLSYNPISQNWTNGLRSNTFYTEPSSKVYHLQDFLVSNTLYPTCFRLRSCHLALSKELSEYKLLVTTTQPLELLSLSEILLNYAGNSHNIIRANLWEEADNYTLAFAPVELNRPDFVDLEIVKAQDVKGINTSDKYLKEFHGEILQGQKFSVFFTKGEKIYTPEANHPIVSPYVVKETVIRDTIIKITGCSEQKILSLNEFDGAILASDSFILSPIKSIQWSREKFEFSVEKGKTVIENIEKYLTEKQFYCLAQDGFTNEAWLEDLRTVQKLVN